MVWFGATAIKFQDRKIISILQRFNTCAFDIVPSKIKISSMAEVVENLQQLLILFVFKTYQLAAAT